MTFVEVLDWVGRISTIVFILTIIAGIYAWFRGILPALLRLGNGLAKRKIAIYAKGDNFSSLNDLLIDSKLFRKGNIVKISSKNDLGKSDGATIFLVYWPDWKQEILDILKIKRDASALVVYAPQEQGFIPKEQMDKLNEHRCVTVTNFRGRLINDVVVSMITTGYDK